MKRIFATGISFLILHTLSSAQNLHFYGLLPAWSQTGTISHKLDYNFFISTTIDAFKENIGGVEYPAKDLQLYIQPSLVYKFSPRFNVAASYTYQRNNPLTDDYSNENRLWQQFIFSQKLSSVKITHRVRFEERFIINRVTHKAPMTNRLRYQLGFSLPLQGATLDTGEFYLNSYNECYFSLTKPRNALYSENWTYAGIGFNAGRMGKIEVGPVYQVSVRNTNQELRTLLLLQLMWSTSINFLKK